MYDPEHRSLDEWQRLADYSYLQSLRKRLDAHEKRARRRAMLSFLGYLLLVVLSAGVVIAAVYVATPGN